MLLICCFFVLGDVKVCFGGLDNHHSSHILVIFKYWDSHQIGSCVYDSGRDRWSHFQPFEFQISVWESNYVCINGVIYLMSRGSPNSTDPFDYVISFDIINYQFRRFMCPDSIQGQTCSLFKFKYKLGVILEYNFGSGLCSYNARIFEGDYFGDVRLAYLSGTPYLSDRTNLCGFVNDTYIIDETNVHLRRPDRASGQVNFLFLDADGNEIHEVIQIHPSNVLWSPINTFEYNESFRKI